ncbi:hypothetical protein MJ8_48230 [Mesorhizobium sp. J8]|nr:hypothetical protein MJ8_48230 [Mesorhizobium sp. J8]
MTMSPAFRRDSFARSMSAWSPRPMPSTGTSLTTDSSLFAFADRLARGHGAAFAIKDRQAGSVPRNAGVSVSGQPLPTVRVTRGMVISASGLTPVTDWARRCDLHRTKQVIEEVETGDVEPEDVLRLMEADETAAETRADSDRVDGAQQGLRLGHHRRRADRRVRRNGGDRPPLMRWRQLYHRPDHRHARPRQRPRRSRWATRKARPGGTASSRAVSPSSGACVPVFGPNCGMPPVRIRAGIQGSSRQAGIHPRLEPVRATCL